MEKYALCNATKTGTVGANELPGRWRGCGRMKLERRGADRDAADTVKYYFKQAAAMK